MLTRGFLPSLAIAVGVLALSVPLAFAIPKDDHKFLDREALTDVLTLEDQAALEKAEAALEVADEVAEEAAKELAEATAIEEMRRQELLDAEQALQDAIDAMEDPEVIEELAEEVAKATVALEMAEEDTAEAKAKSEAADEARDTLAGVVMEIEEEIEKTAELVAAMTDAQVFAMNRNLNNAIASGLLPLFISAEELEAVLDFDKVAINAFVTAYEQRARFERHAVKFEAKAEASGNSRFQDKADAMRERGERHFDRFRAKADAMAAKRAAREEAKEETRNAIAEERRKGARGEAKRNGS